MLLLFVCLSVCLSHAGIVSKTLDGSSCLHNRLYSRLFEFNVFDSEMVCTLYNPLYNRILTKLRYVQK